MSLSRAYAIDLPTDDEQDVLVRTTLMTFNDANVTGNYSVLLAKGSKQFQEQMTIEKLAAAFAGEFENDEVQVKYKLRFAQNNNVWKVIGIDVDAKK